MALSQLELDEHLEGERRDVSALGCMIAAALKNWVVCQPSNRR